MDINSLDILFPETYDSVGNAASAATLSTMWPASTQATAYFRTFNIPTNVYRVEIVVYSGMIYDLTSSSWVAAAYPTYKAWIE